MDCRSLDIGQIGGGNLEVKGLLLPMSNQMKFLPQLFNIYSKVVFFSKIPENTVCPWMQRRNCQFVTETLNFSLLQVSWRLTNDFIQCISEKTERTRENFILLGQPL